MSLLNQVLRDLDERRPAVGPGTLRTASTNIAEHAAADFETASLRPGLLAALSLATVLVLVVGVFGFHQLGGETIRISALQVDTLATVEPEEGGFQTAPVADGPVFQASADPLQHPNPLSPGLSHGLPVGDSTSASSSNAGSAPKRATISGTAFPGEIIERSDTPSEAEPGKVELIPLRNDTLADIREPKATKGAAGASVKTQSSKHASAPTSLVRARAAIDAGELAEAERLLRTYLDHQARDKVARELLVGLMLRGERHEEAMAQIDAGLHQYPQHAVFKLIKARLLAESGDASAAVALLERGQFPEHLATQHRQMLGALYQKQGRFDDAAAQYRLLIARRPRSAEGWVGLAISLDAQGHRDAGGAYRHALAIGRLPTAADSYARRRLAELEAVDQ
jgi:MSHA biogenesis protein MshN